MRDEERSAMVTIDASLGEGGGQILRSSLALSLVTGRPVTLDHIRARRSKPGLRRQHLVAVRAAAEISGAEVQGDVLGSSQLVFRPGPVQPGSYHFAIGTAGSTTLVLQTILPALALARSDSEVALEGGTHNPLAPPLDFLSRAYLPLIDRLGPRVTVTLQRHGFHPGGGGRLSAHIRRAPHLGRLELPSRGPLQDRRVRVLIANLPEHIAQRECRSVAARTGWDPSCCTIEQVSSRGPGNVVLVELASQHVTEVFSSFGQRGVRAETVAGRAADAALRYLQADVAVGQYLADQLLLPLGIGAHQGTGGGHFTTLELSLHATTHINVLKQFLDLTVTVEQQGTDNYRVEVA